ncbi:MULTISPECIES: SURF1 family protein [unclassified Iodidimonas]|jgi:surfeit locus 1 family protein|uniref:SURF1 family protein n=1 Tax=unclassified Iodidimonas TaxID=2626145 RepID=UPI0024832B06|nr:MULTISPECIES: SURF1 family protein [unclassified Iodidimonas]
MMMPRSLSHRFAPGLWPSLLTLIGVLLLIALGQWQVQRLAWKTALLAEIEARTSAPPVALPKDLSADEALRDWRYRPVIVRGTFDHANEIYLHQGRGFHIITPLIRRDGGAPVLVVRGYVPGEKLLPARRPEGLVSGLITMEGLVRMAGEPNLFTPENDPAGNRWYWRDLEAMARAAGLAEVAPVYLDSLHDAPGGWPRGDTTILALPNNHLGYALTWFSFALALLVIYTLYGLRRAKETSKEKAKTQSG